MATYASFDLEAFFLVDVLFRSLAVDSSVGFTL